MNEPTPRIVTGMILLVVLLIAIIGGVDNNSIKQNRIALDALQAEIVTLRAKIVDPLAIEEDTITPAYTLHWAGTLDYATEAFVTAAIADHAAQIYSVHGASETNPVANVENILVAMCVHAGIPFTVLPPWAHAPAPSTTSEEMP